MAHLEKLSVDLSQLSKKVREILNLLRNSGVDENYATLLGWASKFKRWKQSRLYLILFRMAICTYAHSTDDATKGVDLGTDGLGMYG